MRRVASSLLGCFALALTACVPLPIPHKVVDHGFIRGRVVDDETEAPLAGALIYVTHAGWDPAATTDADGRFTIAEHESWSFLWLLPLVPFDPAWQNETLRITYPGLAQTRDGRRPYRELSVSIRSRLPTRIIGDRGQYNRGIEDDVGTLRLKPFEPVPRP